MGKIKIEPNQNIGEKIREKTQNENGSENQFLNPQIPTS